MQMQAIIDYHNPKHVPRRTFSWYACLAATGPSAIFLFSVLIVVPAMDRVSFASRVPYETRVAFMLSHWLKSTFMWGVVLVLPIVIGFLAALVPIPRSAKVQMRRRRASIAISATTIVLIVLLMIWTIVVPWIALMSGLSGSGLWLNSDLTWILVVLMLAVASFLIALVPPATNDPTPLRRRRTAMTLSIVAILLGCSRWRQFSWFHGRR
jgi:hypothetical protein